MTEPNLNLPSPENAALADTLEYTLRQIEANIRKELKRGDETAAFYYREQYALTETIIYALRNNRIARNDKEVEQFIQQKN